MNKTANFQLTQWEKTDRIMMEDFNRDNAAIDAALKANADKAAALQTALAGAGNCEIGLISYTGNGKSGANNPTIINFPKKPTLFMSVVKPPFCLAQRQTATTILLSGIM